LTLTEQQAGVMYAREWWAEKLDFVVLLGVNKPTRTRNQSYPNTKYPDQGFFFYFVIPCINSGQT
jgi:hypothetical protein